MKETVILSRCFPGWDKIKDKYQERDGDIVLWVRHTAYVDLMDAKIILDFLYQQAEEKRMIVQVKKEN